MNGSITGNSPEQHLNKVAELSKSILALPLDKEEDLEQLDQYQQEQIQQKECLERLVQTGISLEQYKNLVRECYVLEQEVFQKLMDHKVQAEIFITKIKNSEKQKHSYYSSYTQSQGYFIDQQK